LSNLNLPVRARRLGRIKGRAAMKYGNCLIGVIILRLTRGPGKVILRKQKGTIIPHLMFQTKDGRLFHYKKVRDLLPGQFTILWFEGKFEEKRRKNDGNNYSNT
jgi:hypothetical protein